MGKRVAGLDIGRRWVRVVVVDVTRRAWSLVGYGEARVLDEEVEKTPVASAGDGADGAEEAPALRPGEGVSSGVLAAIAKLRDAGLLDGVEVVQSAIDDPAIHLTALTFPFANARNIEPVLRMQLDGRLPEDVDDLHVAFTVGGKAPNGEFVVHTAAVAPPRIAAWLGGLSAAAVDPRTLDVAPFHLFPAAALLLPDAEPVAVVDIGARQTRCLVFQGPEVQLARSISGGGEHITDALAEFFRIDLDTARTGKHEEARIDAGLDGTDADPAARETAEICRAAMKPVIRELRRTLQSHATAFGTPVRRIALVGGGARLRGLVDYLAQSLGVDASLVDMQRPELLGDGTRAIPDVAYFGALSLALRGNGITTDAGFNLRHGPFAFRGDREWLRTRAPHLALLAGAVILSASLFTGARLLRLSAELSAVDAALEKVTEQVFGTPVIVPERIRARLDESVGTPFLPASSAYDVFLSLGGEVTNLRNEGYEVTASTIEVDMERRIFELRGVADSADSVDNLLARLGKLPCLRRVQRDSLAASAGQAGFDFAIKGAANCAPEDEETP